MYKSVLILLATSLLFSQSVSAESILEMHQRLCADGKQKSCERAAMMEEADDAAKRIEELGDAFAMTVNRSEMETDNKPELETAYPIVMENYFAAEKSNGIEPVIPELYIGYCAQHYHEHWVDRKLVWPTNESGQPDWAAIYYYIVDHYYGYCLRSVMTEANS